MLRLNAVKDFTMIEICLTYMKSINAWISLDMMVGLISVTKQMKIFIWNIKTDDLYRIYSLRYR